MAITPSNPTRALLVRKKPSNPARMQDARQTARFWG